MVSFAHLLTLLSVLVSLAVAEEAGAAKSGAVDEKWIGVGVGVGVSGGIFTSGYNYPVTPTGLEAGNSVARRSDSLPFNSNHLYPRGQQDNVSCKAKDGTVQEITASHCQKAIDSLISQKSSSASFGTCSVSMANPNGKLEVNGAPAEALHTAASEILKACSSGSGEASSAAPQKVTRRSPAEEAQKSNQQFAMIISKNVADSGN
ncbi:hypothetical protein PCANC_28020 [Puccinia coronata f. sp. avenae]|uniref:Uncharacterized protein n=1 Tax=Puccinia coronata f. sp. avenae TaxID=200324 RepID=A0A2N5RUD2_9BASI|nr:hypothetical protein PCANC_28020 [Puccinia coronata f. sp. avenae]